MAFHPDSKSEERLEEHKRTFCAVALMTSYSASTASMSSSLGILNRVILFTVFDDMVIAGAVGVSHGGRLTEE